MPKKGGINHSFKSKKKYSSSKYTKYVPSKYILGDSIQNITARKLATHSHAQYPPTPQQNLAWGVIKQAMRDRADDFFQEGNEDLEYWADMLGISSIFLINYYKEEFHGGKDS